MDKKCTMTTPDPKNSGSANKPAEPSKITKLTVKTGQVVFTQGERGEAAYLVDSGSVTIFQMISGRRIELGTIKPGEIFGEMAVIDDGRRMATAVATADSQLSRIPKSVFEKKLEASDRFIKGILNVFLSHIRGNHRTFLRRPRSFRDKVAVIDEVAEYIGFFADKLEGQHAAALNAKLGTLRSVLDDLRTLSDELPDKRRHTILNVEEGYGKLAAKA